MRTFYILESVSHALPFWWFNLLSVRHLINCNTTVIILLFIQQSSVPYKLVLEYYDYEQFFTRNKKRFHLGWF